MIERAETATVGPWSIPDSWIWTQAGDVAAIVGGGTPSTADPRNFDGGSIPWITPADLSGYSQKTIASGARSISERGLSQSGAQLVPEGSVLFSSRAPIGYVSIAACELSTSQGFKTFVLKPALSPDFVYYYLQRAKELAKSLASGTTFLELSKSKAETLPIPIAPLNEQRRVVEAIETRFTRLDAGVRALERTRANLKRLRASVLQDSLRGPWTHVRLDEIAESNAPIIYGILQPGPQVRDGVPYVRPTEIVRDRIQIDLLRRTSPRIADRYARAMLIGGDVILTIVGTIGKVALVPETLQGGNITQSSCRVRPDQSKVTPGFLAWILRSPLVRRQFEKIRLGTAVQRLNLEDVRELLVPLPPIREQRAIAAEVDSSFSIIEEVDAQAEHGLVRCNRLRTSILKRAFEGRLVPQDPADESAAVLLQRLKIGESARTFSATKGRRSAAA